MLVLAISDLPLNVSWQQCWKTAAKAGIDGIELMGGPRVWWNRRRINAWIDKYHLPVLSVHQPAWEGLNLIVVRANLQQAKKWANNYVIHPPLLKSPDDGKYFQQLQTWSKKEAVTVMLENMPLEKMMKWTKVLGQTEKKWTQLEAVAYECRKRNWQMVLDTSHLQMVEPDERRLNKILPLIGNIHISDWDDKRQHLGLGRGKMNLDKWLSWLKKNYHRQITLELSPRYWVDEAAYLTEVIQSLKVLHQCVTKT